MLPPYKRKPRLRTYKKGSQVEFGNYEKKDAGFQLSLE
jgi:hypothetical protein